MSNRPFDCDEFDEPEMGPLFSDAPGVPKRSADGDPGKERAGDVEDEDDLPFPEVWEAFEEGDDLPETPRVIELPPPEEPARADGAESAMPATAGPDSLADPVAEAPSEEADPPSHAVLGPGDVLAGRYEIVERLSLGGIGAWYRVVDAEGPDTEVLCVLPEAAARPRVRQRLAKRCEIGRTLRHPGVAALFDAGEDSERGLLFVTAEFVEGTSLRVALDERGGRLPAWEVIDLGLQLCDALGAIHRRTAHQALSPDSVVVQPDGNIKIVDLGLALAVPPPVLSSEVANHGNKAYRAPELAHWTEDGDARADLYSLGVLLYQMFTGRLPSEAPLPPSHAAVGVPPAVDDIVLQCLRPRPEDRPRSVAAVRKALRKAAGSPSRHPLLAPLVAATLLLGATVPLLLQLARDPAETAWAQAARFAPSSTPSAEAEAPAEPVEPETIPLPASDPRDTGKAEPTPTEEPVAASLPPPAEVTQTEPVSEPAEEEVVILPAPDLDGDGPEESAEPEPDSNQRARTSPPPPPVELEPRASITIGEIRSSADDPPAEVPSPPDPRGTLIGAPAYAVEFVRLVEGTGRDPLRAEVRYQTLGGGERRRVVSVGDEVGDGWRLESIDPAKPSIRLRKGTRTASLTAVAPRAADAPKPATATRSLEATRAAALRARTEAEAVDAETLAADAFVQGVYALNEAEAWSSAGWNDEALQSYKKAEGHFDEATTQALRAAVRSRSTTAAAPPPGSFHAPATGKKQGPSAFYEAEG